jgi:hypothetical protein
MPTVFDVNGRRDLGRRLDRLMQSSTPRWGRMDCSQMLAHLTDALLMALGDLPVRPRPGVLRFAPVRHAIIHWLPFPRSAPTAPELITRRANDCALETAEVKALMERFAQRAGAREWAEHPAFGRLSERDWGVLVYRHMDHHLRQFGV